MSGVFTADPAVEVAHRLGEAELSYLLDTSNRPHLAEVALVVGHRARAQYAVVLAASAACEPHVDWSEARPVALGMSPAELLADCRAAKVGEIVVRWDCSGFTLWACEASGMKNPMGRGFAYADGLGDTEILLNNPELEPHYADNRLAATGAIGVYYDGDLPQHAVVHVDTPGVSDPKVGSMGSDAGPLVIPKSWEDQAHPGQEFTWLSVGRLL